MKFSSDTEVMQHALSLARRHQGAVEPNPMVGAVLVDDRLNLIAAGAHEKFGGPHAEVNAIRSAGDRARDSTLFVTLEPCHQHGKTPPCCDAILEAGIGQVVIAALDPSEHTNGQSVDRIFQAGISVHTGLLESEALDLIAPFVKKEQTGLPWVIAKWAMTLDGKIAARTGHSQWISSPESRELVHALRGRVDAIIVGAGTARADDPMLTARPAGPRTALRVVIDTDASLAPASRLVRTAREFPLLVACRSHADEAAKRSLAGFGVEVMPFPDGPGGVSLPAVLKELGRRECTNVLVEGGSQLLGSLFDSGHIDEAHVFVAPKLIGGESALSPLSGFGLSAVPDNAMLHQSGWQQVGDDLYLHGRLQRES